jgi:hypothetical protein
VPSLAIDADEMLKKIYRALDLFQKSLEEIEKGWKVAKKVDEHGILDRFKYILNKAFNPGSF